MKTWLYVLMACLMLSCQGRSSSRQNTQMSQPSGSSNIALSSSGSSKSTQPLEKTFRRVVIPAMITDQAARAEYAALHYWDAFDFSDTCFIASAISVSERAFADYLQLLFHHVPYQRACESITRMLSMAEVDTLVYRFWVEEYRKYCYDPNSPMMNDEYYIPVLQAMTSSSVLTSTQRQTASVNLAVVSRNRPGTPASDFQYKQLSGQTSSLYRLKSDYVLLFFNNPGCHACGEIKDGIVQSSRLNDMISDGTLCVLAVYPDEDLTEWRNHHNDFPSTWINAYDANVTIKQKELYDLKAIPMLYLLDKNKRVLLKDCTITQLIDYFNE